MSRTGSNLLRMSLLDHYWRDGDLSPHGWLYGGKFAAQEALKARGGMLRSLSLRSRLLQQLDYVAVAIGSHVRAGLAHAKAMGKRRGRPKVSVDGSRVALLRA